MLQLWRATELDLEFLIKIDLDDEGYTPGTDDDQSMDLAERRAKMAGFVQDSDKAAWVIEDTGSHALAGALLCLFRDLDSKSSSSLNWDFFDRIREFLPEDGMFAEVFNLWIDPAFRRQGLATKLKRQLERESRRRGLSMVYTHTELSNPHVIELNRKLGYREIRRGTIWDEIVRVSLVKDLP